MKEGDQIKVKKPGHLINGAIAEILNINLESKRPIKVSISIEWFLTFEEVELIGKTKSEKDIIDNLEVVTAKSKPAKEVKVKRAYQKKDKSQPAKQKRAYNKKINL